MTAMAPYFPQSGPMGMGMGMGMGMAYAPAIGGYPAALYAPPLHPQAVASGYYAAQQVRSPAPSLRVVLVCRG